MHDNATGLRERRMVETARRLVQLAREWTVTRGFADFTVDELCEAAGLSRRSFFNYFATKEDAVLGLWSRADTSPEEAFVAAGESTGGLSATLMADLAELMLVRWEALEFGWTELDVLLAALEASPRVLGRAMQLSREQELVDAGLVEQREGLAAGDLRAHTLVHLLGTILRDAVRDTLIGGGTEPLRAAFDRRLAVARDLFSC